MDNSSLKISFKCTDSDKIYEYDFCNDNEAEHNYKKVNYPQIHICCFCHSILFSWNATIYNDNINAFERFRRYHGIS